MKLITIQSLLLIAGLCAANASFLCAARSPVTDADPTAQEGDPDADDQSAADPLADDPQRRLGGLQASLRAMQACLRSASTKAKRALVDTPVDATKKYLADPLYAKLPQPVKKVINAVAHNRGLQATGITVGVAVIAQYALVAMDPACNFFNRDDYAAAACEASARATADAWSAWAMATATSFVDNIREYYPGGA